MSVLAEPRRVRTTTVRTDGNGSLRHPHSMVDTTSEREIAELEASAVKGIVTAGYTTREQFLEQLPMLREVMKRGRVKVHVRAIGSDPELLRALRSLNAKQLVGNTPLRVVTPEGEMETPAASQLADPNGLNEWLTDGHSACVDIVSRENASPQSLEALADLRKDHDNLQVVSDAQSRNTQLISGLRKQLATRAVNAAPIILKLPPNLSTQTMAELTDLLQEFRGKVRLDAGSREHYLSRLHQQRALQEHAPKQPAFRPAATAPPAPQGLLASLGSRARSIFGWAKNRFFGGREGKEQLALETA